MFNRLTVVLSLVVGSFALALSAGPALAVIAKPTSLKSIVADAAHVALATVDSVEPQRPALTLTLTEDLKGAATARQILVNLAGNPKGTPPSGPADVTDRVKAGMQAVVFFVEGDSPFALVYCEGSWYRIARNAEGAKAWPYLYGELYLRRTFKGTTAELKQAVLDVKDGKKGPDLDANEKPGLGPTLPGVTAAATSTADEPKDGAKIALPPATKDAKDATPAKDAKPAPAKSSPAKSGGGDGGIFKIVGGIVIAAGVALIVYVFVIRKKK